jgi:hypothetical protein
MDQMLYVALTEAIIQLANEDDGRAEVAAILTAHGVARASALQPHQWCAVLDEVEETTARRTRLPTSRSV